MLRVEERNLRNFKTRDHSLIEKPIKITPHHSIIRYHNSFQPKIFEKMSLKV